MLTGWRYGTRIIVQLVSTHITLNSLFIKYLYQNPMQNDVPAVQPMSSWVKIYSSGRLYYFSDPSLGGDGMTSWHAPICQSKCISWVKIQSGLGNSTFYYSDPMCGGNGAVSWHEPVTYSIDLKSRLIMKLVENEIKASSMAFQISLIDIKSGLAALFASYKERKYFVRCLEKENSVCLLNMINRIILLCSHTLGLGLKKKRWRVFGYCQFHTSLILEWSFLFTFNKILKLSSYFWIRKQSKNRKGIISTILNRSSILHQMVLFIS